MRRAPDDARGSDGARGGVELIHASLSSAEKLDMARARGPRAASVVRQTVCRVRPHPPTPVRPRMEVTKVSKYVTSETARRKGGCLPLDVTLVSSQNF